MRKDMSMICLERFYHAAVAIFSAAHQRRNNGFLKKISTLQNKLLFFQVLPLCRMSK